MKDFKFAFPFVNKEITTARRVGITWMIISYIGTFIIGTLGTAYLFNKGILLGANPAEVSVSGSIIYSPGTYGVNL